MSEIGPVFPSSKTRRGVRVAGSGESPDGGREYVVRSTKLIAPGETGPIPYRLKREARVTDIDVGDDAELVRVALGPRRISLEDESGGEKKVLSDVLAAEPYDGNAGAFVVLNVRNTGSEPRYVEATIRVVAERGPEVDAPSPFRMRPDGTPMGAGRKLRTPGRPTPFSPMPRVVSPPEIGARRPGGGVRRPPPGGAKARARERMKATPAPSEVVITVPALIQPAAGGEKVVVFFRSHVEALLRLFAFRSPIRKPQRSALVRELRAARERESSDVGIQLGEVGVSLARSDLDRLFDALLLHREQQLEDEGGRIVAALKRAIEISPTVDSGSAVQRSAISDQPSAGQPKTEIESEKSKTALTLIATANGSSELGGDEDDDDEDVLLKEITEE